jgi:hypothetical protein
MIVVCSETRNGERNFEFKKSLALNEEVGLGVILKCTNKPLAID